MQRLLKFRAWVAASPHYPQMHEPYMAIQGEPDLETLQSFMHHYGDEKLLMQYTGLKDKNGTDIYECDIVNDGHGNLAPIYWEQHHCQFLVMYESEAQEVDNLVTVIGNIYQNPELLKTI